MRLIKRDKKISQKGPIIRDRGSIYFNATSDKNDQGNLHSHSK